MRDGDEGESCDFPQVLEHVECPDAHQHFSTAILCQIALTTHNRVAFRVDRQTILLQSRYCC